MQAFLAGTPAVIPVAFVDRSGNDLDVVSAVYRIIGNKGEELLAETALFDSASVGDDGATPEVAPSSLTIPAELNSIAAIDIDSIESEDMSAISVREMRAVEFRLLLKSGNTVTRKEIYALEPSDVLIVGLNSFQSYAEAQMTAMDIPELGGWDEATEAERIAAMVEARIRLTRLRFRDVTRGQSYLREEVLVGDLSLVTPREFGSLTNRLRAALRKAQVAEADSLLGGDPEADRRRSGLTQETVGESTQTWRTSKPLDLPVSRKALSYLAGFVSMNLSIGRS